jgi:hypothetical protein
VRDEVKLSANRLGHSIVFHRPCAAAHLLISWFFC